VSEFIPWRLHALQHLDTLDFALCDYRVACKLYEFNACPFTSVGTYRIHGQSVIYRVIEAGLKAGYRAFGMYNSCVITLSLF
jgi:hypothetical protein